MIKLNKVGRIGTKDNCVLPICSSEYVVQRENQIYCSQRCRDYLGNKNRRKIQRIKKGKEIRANKIANRNQPIGFQVSSVEDNSPEIQDWIQAEVKRTTAKEN